MNDFQQYRRKQIAELRPYVDGEDMTGISVSDVDKAAGSPKDGDMIARNPANHADKWLVSAQYFADNFGPVYVAEERGIRREALEVAGKLAVSTNVDLFLTTAERIERYLRDGDTSLKP